MRAYGFVLAVPNIRGGGEFGEEWHLGGTRERKVCSYVSYFLKEITIDNHW